MTTFKVSAKSKVNSVAGAITGIIVEEGRVEIKAIGSRRGKPGNKGALQLQGDF